MCPAVDDKRCARAEGLEFRLLCLRRTLLEEVRRLIGNRSLKHCRHDVDEPARKQAVISGPPRSTTTIQ
jgi:hypothetical protein